MFEVNDIEINNSIKELSNLINKYEDIMLDLYKQLEEACVNWQDANSLSFLDCVQEDKKDTSLFIGFITSRKDFYSFIYEKYSELGKKIAFNLNNKSQIVQLINNCYDSTCGIVNQFYNIDTSFYYEERNSIIRQRDKVISVKNSLYQLKSSVQDVFNKIENIEKEVEIKIKKLSVIKINDFGFYFTSFGEASKTGHKKMSGILHLTEFEKNIDKIILYMSEENKCINNIYNGLLKCNSFYKTSYIGELENDIERLKVYNNEIGQKRKKCIKTLYDVIDIYDTTANKIKNDFLNLGEKNE